MGSSDTRLTRFPLQLRTAVVRLPPVLTFIAFAFIVYGHVFSDGLCCADDSTNAIVAKNLAFGRGYANSLLLDGTPGTRLFDPRITTGPVLNVPAAGLIYVTGNVPWAPGFVTATLSLSLLLTIGAVLSRIAGPQRSAAYASIAMLVFYTKTAGVHFEHWYSLIGEIPAALLSIAGTVVLARPGKTRGDMSAGLLYGLALMTKMLALLSVIPVAVWLLFRVGRATSDRLRYAVDALWGSRCVCRVWCPL
jgi:hypothetical protein